MTVLDPALGFDLLVIPDFLEPPTRARLLTGLRCAPNAPATVHTGSPTGLVNDLVRKTTRLYPPPETVEFVKDRLLERGPAVERRFGVHLRGCEEPQFLRYQPGDYFVAHQDGNTGLIRSERETSRKVSAVIFLSTQSDGPSSETYCGGSLVLHKYGVGPDNPDRHLELRGAAGTLVAFRPETTHEVLPVTHGERLTIACWYV